MLYKQIKKYPWNITNTPLEYPMNFPILAYFNHVIMIIPYPSLGFCNWWKHDHPRRSLSVSCRTGSRKLVTADMRLLANVMSDVNLVMVVGSQGNPSIWIWWKFLTSKLWQRRWQMRIWNNPELRPQIIDSLAETSHWMIWPAMRGWSTLQVELPLFAKREYIYKAIYLWNPMSIYDIL